MIVIMFVWKVFGQWRYNNDGVNIVNSKNITVKNSFVHSFDDSITIKGIDRYAETDNENILSENCVLWCDWGKLWKSVLKPPAEDTKTLLSETAILSVEETRHLIYRTETAL